MSSVADQPSTDPPTPGRDADAPPPARSGGDHVAPSRREREGRRFGGIKLGCGFFGWLAATGLSVVLLAAIAGVGAAVADVRGTTAADVTADPAGAGLVGAIVVLAVLAVAYFCGGYVAGRMARFNGAKQGLAVWLWAVLVTVVLALSAAVVGSRTGLATLISIPSLPVTSSEATLGAVIGVAAAAAAALLGAVLGGLAGMRFHRRVDRAGLGG